MEQKINTRCELFQLDAPDNEQHHGKFFYHLWNIQKSSKLEVSIYAAKLIQLLDPLVDDSKRYEIHLIISPLTYYNALINQTHVQIDKTDLLNFISEYKKKAQF